MRIACRLSLERRFCCKTESKMDKNVSILTLQKPFETSTIEVNSPFACLIYSNQQNVTRDEMSSVANLLINSGCRYAVCAGLNCLDWHDSIDITDTIHDPTLQNFIMSTWHENESVEDVVWFWLNLTDFDDVAFENYLALLIGNSHDVEEKIREAVKNNSL